ncbi:hypothetical protein Taro_043248 [Colocasia esculenta]|uniref:Uncharacterized protein n=1 Tax=Colocasia esculenta TaxID=4460 RepID=A0A843X3U2_COLES|nr:hypothetical protein [Colocasia esculenta]
MPRRASFYDTGGFKYMPRRTSFYDAGGFKYMPRRTSFYDAGGLKYRCLNVCRFKTPEDLDYANRDFVTTCSVSVRASAAGLDHEDRVPTGVDTCGLCKLAHGRRPWAGGRLVGTFRPNGMRKSEDHTVEPSSFGQLKEETDSKLVQGPRVGGVGDRCRVGWPENDTASTADGIWHRKGGSGRRRFNSKAAPPPPERSWSGWG